MSLEKLLSQKQIEFVQKANKRWNFKGGATRSGKTYLDFKWVIPMRIREREPKEGLVFIMGVTKNTIERNVLEPMRKIYSEDLVSRISSDNKATLFGQEVYCLGAEKVSQISKIRGSSVKYCYGDEVADWNVEVFEMLKSRLDKSYSCFDGTFNPSFPTHWLKEFLDSDVDIFYQTYTLDDNPFNEPEFVENLKREYAGTVYYDRYILGKWQAAEGAIYKVFTENEQDFYVTADTLPRFERILIGVDFGKNKSGHAFTATGITLDCKQVYILASEWHKAEGTVPDDVIRLLRRFVENVEYKYGAISEMYPDSAESTMINLIRSCFKVSVYPSEKGEVINRIRFTTAMMSFRLLKIIKNECRPLIESFKNAVYDDKAGKDARLDDGSYNVDSLDSWEYSIFRYQKKIMLNFDMQNMRK